MYKINKNFSYSPVIQKPSYFSNWTENNNNVNINTQSYEQTQNECEEVNLDEYNLDSLNTVQEDSLQVLSEGLISVALDEYNNRENRNEYEWFSDLEWCAAFATWVYQNTYIKDQTAAEIAGLPSGREYWFTSTGQLMMHFYTADNPILGFDYTNESYYGGENPNIGFFYNDYASNYAGMNVELGKVSPGEMYIPKPGDFIFFNHAEGDENQPWKPNQSGLDSVQDHTGIVLDVKTDSEGALIEITTIEGNISDNYYQRTIKFDGTDSYSEYIIGYGAIKSIPK